MFDRGMLRHVVRDWNGTLVDDVKLCVDILNDILNCHGKNKISLSAYKNTFFFPVAKFYGSIGLPSSGPKYEELAEHYISQYRSRFKECKLHHMALNIVEKLKKMGISQSVLSAGEQNDLEQFTSYYGINNWISHIDGANNIEAKGKRDRVGKHFSKLNLNANEVLFVGDTLHDLEIARLVDCRALLFEHGHFDKERLCKVPAQTIRCLTEVIEGVHD